MKRTVLVFFLVLFLPSLSMAITKGVAISPGFYHLKIGNGNENLYGAEATANLYLTSTEFLHLKAQWIDGSFGKGIIFSNTQPDDLKLQQYSGRVAFGYLPLNKPFNIGPIFGLEYLYRNLEKEHYNHQVSWEKLFLMGGLTAYVKTIFGAWIDTELLIKVPVYRNMSFKVDSWEDDFSPVEQPSFEAGLSLNYWRLSLRGFWQYEKQEEHTGPPMNTSAVETQTLGLTLGFRLF